LSGAILRHLLEEGMMAIVVTAELAGGTAEFDMDLTQRLDLIGNPPPGIKVRVAGPIEGGWRVISVWESQEAWDTFRTGRLEPMFREVGRELPRFTMWEAQNLRILAST
jgi:hypothetical protein